MYQMGGDPAMQQQQMNDQMMQEQQMMAQMQQQGQQQGPPQGQPQGGPQQGQQQPSQEEQMEQLVAQLVDAYGGPEKSIVEAAKVLEKRGEVEYAELIRSHPAYQQEMEAMGGGDKGQQPMPEGQVAQEQAMRRGGRMMYGRGGRVQSFVPINPYLPLHQMGGQANSYMPIDYSYPFKGRSVYTPY